MKKIISVLAMLVLICTSCIGVMAAPSVSSPMKEVTPVRGTITLSDGSVITVNDAETMQKYIVIRGTDVAAEQISGYSSLAVFEVVFKDGVQSGTVVFHVAGVKAGDKLIVRMLINGEWVDLEAEAIGDDLVQVKLTQPGVIEILKADSSQNGGNGSNNGSGNGSDNGSNNGSGNAGSNGTQSNGSGANTSATSPKTGENNALPAACAVFFVCALAATVSGLKLKRR